MNSTFGFVANNKFACLSRFDVSRHVHGC